jgi:hypothetical protein
MEGVGTYILWTFGPFYGLLVYFVCRNLVYFSRFGILLQKNLATLIGTTTVL